MLSSALNPSGEDTYAQLCRQHVAAILSDCEKYAVETDLSRRVNTWQSHVEPILEEQEQHPVFDIDEYGSSILKDMERSGGVGESSCSFMLDFLFPPLVLAAAPPEKDALIPFLLALAGVISRAH